MERRDSDQTVWMPMIEHTTNIFKYLARLICVQLFVAHIQSGFLVVSKQSDITAVGSVEYTAHTD